MLPAELRAWRERRGLTQAEALAWYYGNRASEWSPAERRDYARTWRRWELGERAIPQPLVARVRRFRT